VVYAKQAFGSPESVVERKEWILKRQVLITIRVKTCRFCLGVHHFRPGNELNRGKIRQAGNRKIRLKTL
jgi:hypothetical protein